MFVSWRVSAVGPLLGALVALSGCATVKHQAAVEQVYEYTYPRPLEDLWPEVREFVSEEGFPPLGSPGQYVMISDWTTSFNENERRPGASYRVSGPVDAT